MRTIEAHLCEYPVLHIPTQRTTMVPCIISIEEGSGFWEYRVIMTMEVDGKTERRDEGGKHTLEDAITHFNKLVEFAN